MLEEKKSTTQDFNDTKQVVTQKRGILIAGVILPQGVVFNVETLAK